MGNEAASSSGLMGRLRERTGEHHARAEQRELQQRMVKGRLTRAEYGAWIGQMLLVHRALERAVEAARALPESDVLGAILPEHYHSRNLEQDAKFYDLPAATALPSTARLIAKIESAADRSAYEVFGMYYVLEGSMNGNVYIAKALGRGLGLTEDGGLAYLTPYGARQREVWSEFKQAGDGVSASEEQMIAAENAAKAMFDGIAEMSDEVVKVAGAVGSVS